MRSMLTVDLDAALHPYRGLVSVWPTRGSILTFLVI